MILHPIKKVGFHKEMIERILLYDLTTKNYTYNAVIY